MARPLSEQKRAALISATTQAVAEMGTAASTSKIATMAGVSEGTIFTYFPTKDELFNVVYLEIKQDLAQVMLRDYPMGGPVQDKIKHVWNAYIGWGHAYPDKRKAMQRLNVSEKITRETRRSGADMFDEINQLMGVDPAGCSMEEGAAAFRGALMDSVATTTLEFIINEPARIDAYREAGFAFFWSGLQR